MGSSAFEVDHPPVKPHGLDAKARTLWNLTWRALMAQGTWQPSDVEALARYVAAVQTARTMRTAAQDRPWVEGSTGQLVAHPGWKVAADADRDAHRYAEALLLTPASRRRAGVGAARPSDLDHLLG